MTDTLLDQVHVVEAARREAAALSDAWNDLCLDLNERHRALIASAAEARQRVVVEEQNLKALALVEYDRTKQKRVAPGVSIALKTELVYNKNDAEAWAIRTQVALVPAHVDLKEFERIAKNTSFSFVEARYLPTVRLDTDLGAALAATEVPSTQEVT